MRYMVKKGRNYIVYCAMLLIMGGLIYLTLFVGDTIFNTSSALSSVDTSLTPFNLFMSFIEGNLRNPLTILLLQIIVVLVAVRFFGFLFNLIGQPGVIGEIVAGIVLGPSLLGLFFPEIQTYIFPEHSLGNLALLSQIGLVLFMFVIGMELDFDLLKNKITETLVISHAGILFPFLLGVVGACAVYSVYVSSHIAFLPFALFVGISMSITAFPVLARIIQERNMTKTHTGLLSIASAANDDVTAWCLLAVVIAIAKAGSVAGALFSILAAILYIVVMFAIVRPFLKKIGEVYANQEVINKTFVAFILLVLILSSCLTEIIGIHALFGAFLAGVVMPQNIGFRKIMIGKIEDISLVFFLPLFFAYTGLRTHIGLIDSMDLWLVALLFTLLAIVGKLGGCAVAARLTGSSWKESLQIGTLMNTRGLMELVALNIGYEMGVLPPRIFVILVIMALVTTFITTPLLHFIEWMYKVKKEIAVANKKFLFFFGRPEAGASMLNIYHLILGEKMKGSTVIAVHYTIGTDVNPLDAERYSMESFEFVNRRAAELGIEVTNIYGVTDTIVQEMTKLVRRESPDMLLIGAGPGAQKLLPGGKFLWLTLLRDKTNEMLGNIKSPVAIYANAGFSGEGNIGAVVSTDSDLFIVRYLWNILSQGKKLKLFIPEQHSDIVAQRVEELKIQHSEAIDIMNYKDLTLFKGMNQQDLLIVSTLFNMRLREDAGVDKQTPSLLIIRDILSN